MKEHIRHLRNDYKGESLDEKTVLPEPLEQFEKWFKEAFENHVPDPNAMVLATAGKDALPSVRVVLLKDYSPKGFTFYTNYNSQKGKQIEENPHGALLFFWPQLHRQIRIEGTIEQVDPAVSESYFHERPFESRISAWVSPQSAAIENKTILEGKYRDFEAAHTGKEIPYPVFWGGYCLKPTAFEFWQGQPNRLHDRVKYTCTTNDTWIINPIAP